MAARRVAITRKFAVILKDEIEALVPEDVEDVEEWALNNFDKLYSGALGKLPNCPAWVVAEDSYVCDVDSIDDEIEVTIEENT